MAGELGFFEIAVEGGEESIAELGRFRLCRDDQGSRFGLHEPPLA